MFTKTSFQTLVIREFKISEIKWTHYTFLLLQLTTDDKKVADEVPKIDNKKTNKLKVFSSYQNKYLPTLS